MAIIVNTIIRARVTRVPVRGKAWQPIVTISFLNLIQHANLYQCTNLQVARHLHVGHLFRIFENLSRNFRWYRIHVCVQNFVKIGFLVFESEKVHR